MATIELSAQQIVLLSDLTHDRLEIARRRLKKMPKKDRLAQHTLIESLGRLLQFLDAHRLDDIDAQAKSLFDRIQRIPEAEELPEPVSPAA